MTDPNNEQPIRTVNLIEIDEQWLDRLCAFIKPGALEYMRREFQREFERDASDPQ